MTCYLPTDFTLTVQSKIEQSKIQAEVSGLNDPGASAFCFPAFHSQFHLPFALCSLSAFKMGKGKIGKENESKKHQKTTYLQGKFKSKTKTTKTQPVFVPVFWLGLYQTVSQCKAGKRSREQGRKNQIRKSKNKENPENKLERKGLFWEGQEECFQWHLNMTCSCPTGSPLIIQSKIEQSN